jgi:hypothetical protein
MASSPATSDTAPSVDAELWWLRFTLESFLGNLMSDDVNVEIVTQQI